MGDEFCASNTVVCGVSSCGCVVLVGGVVASGTVAGTDVAGMVVEAGATGSSTGSGRTVVDVV